MKLLKNISKNFFLIIIIIVFFFLYFVLNFLIFPNPKSLIKPSIDTTISIISSELPFHIKIPKIGVNSSIEEVGLNKDGEVGSPLKPNNVAWFKDGPIPGSIGNAIIVGHSGWVNNTPAVFNDLKKLEEGDEIYIENTAGVVMVFVVKKLKTYDKNDQALDVFNSNDNKSHLNLISCTGIWNILEESHDSRIVVFADLIEFK